jgi:hypothetical protein
MAFSASHIEITLRYTILGQNCQTRRVYTWDGVAIATATPSALGEAWWNHYKAAWRALAVPNVLNAEFKTVLVREVGGGLAYGEFAIPSGEAQGTRDATGLGSISPSYEAVGCRLTVASGVTRPGQFRIGFMTDADSSGNNVAAGFLALAEDVAELYSQNNILGAPTATGVLTPMVVRFGADNDTIAASQDVTGHILNTLMTSQVSRRAKHGT